MAFAPTKQSSPTRLDANDKSIASTRPPSNPFATRFTRPGRLPYCFDGSTLGVERGVELCEGVIGSECSRLIGPLVTPWCKHRLAWLIVGPHGTGKSTLLHTLVPTLEQHFSSINWLRLGSCGSRRVLQRWQHHRQVGHEIRALRSAWEQPGLLVIDGAEQISPWRRRELLRWSSRCGHTILATSHRPLSGMDVLYRTRLDAKLIRGLTMELLRGASSQVTANVREVLVQRDLDRVSNLRELWFELYDVVQSRLVQTEISEASDNRNGCATFRDDDSIQRANGCSSADGRRGRWPPDRRRGN